MHNHPDECKECAAERRHEVILNVLLEINQSLQTLITERRSDASLASLESKLESIRYTLNNK